MIRQFQQELKAWQEVQFPDLTAEQALLGAVEELGELAHAHLSGERGLHQEEDHTAGAQDAIVDTLIYLANYCNMRGWDLQSLLLQVWHEVQKRDYRVTRQEED